jgi:membrane-bound serine protease (ClpP class)
VIEVTGYIDPLVVDFVEQSIAGAERSGAIALVLQLDSPGVVIPDEELLALLDRIRTSRVPVDVWIGPSGSAATGRAALLAGVASELAMAPGTRFGLAGENVSDALLATAVRTVPPGTMGNVEADDLGITTRAGPTLGDLAVGLPGFQSREVTQGEQTRREPVTQVRFGKLSLVASMMHAVASPAVAYLLFAIGLGLFVFELFTAGVGIAGAVGAGSFVLACYGLAALPNHWYGIALLTGAFVAFAVDVQTGVPRFWTGVGVAAFVAGSLLLYDGVPLSWLTLAVGFAGVLLTFLSGMPSMVRTRFSTPTIGREWMIGELGRAVTDVNPDGVVQIREALWRATTNRATPIEQLDRVRVVGIEGLVLEVEPEEGGARDYRDRGRRQITAAHDTHSPNSSE